MKEIMIGPNEEGQRFDRFLLKYFNNSTRANVYKLIRKKVFKVNGVRADEAQFIKEGDVVSVYLSDEAFNSLIKEEKRISPLKLDLDIVYEDEEILVVNKPRGLLTHPDKTEYKETLATKVGLYLKDYATRTFKPASIQRLDKNTSGLVIFCKTYDSLKKYNEMMRNREIDKYYLAVVEGDIREDGRVETRLSRDSDTNISRIADEDDEDSKASLTLYRPLERYGDYTLIEVKLETGRTHQIRVSMSSIGHPIAGDVKYGARRLKNVVGQLLHGYKVVVRGTEYKSRSEEIDDFTRMLKTV
jgi:23S rRNA pseudouridine955/2504/2580 synthase